MWQIRASLLWRTDDFPKVRCAIEAASPSSREPIASVLCSPGRRPSGFGSTARGPPKKSLRDFATLANLGHFAFRSA
jgi:hypothetical protein